MKDRLVTLIGGGGFLGRYVARELLRRGARVRIAERDPRRAWFLRSQGGLGQTQFAAVDVTRPESLDRALVGSDAVVNLAGSFGADMVQVQADGARNVAQAAARAGAGGLVHISAIGADAASASAYGRSKAAGEAAVRDAFPSATILRPSVMFGREDQFVNRFARMISLAPVVPVLRGQTRFQPVYVADTAEAVAHALDDAERHGGKIYELGGPDILTMGELLRWVAREIGRSPHFVDVPDGLGAMLGYLPGAPITRDQWLMLQSDNVVSAGAEGLAAFGISPTPMPVVAPSWLVSYRRHGRFGDVGQAA